MTSAISVLWVCLSVVGAPAPGAEVVKQAESQAATILYDRAAELFAAGQIDEAQRRVAAAYLLAPDNRLRLLLSKILVAQGNCEQALPLLAAIELDALDGAARPTAETDRKTMLETCDSSVEQVEASHLLAKRAAQLATAANHREAVALLRKAETIAAGDRLWLLQAKELEASKQCSQALALYRKIRPENLADSERNDVQTARERLQVECDKAPSNMVLVPAGPFTMGATTGEQDEAPVHTVRMPAYYLDRTEVTVGQFRRCIEAGACGRDTYNESAQKPYCNLNAAGRDEHPMNCINWQGAQQYCQWAGKRLPTEAEWEKAARGTEGSLFPWGQQEPDCSRCIISAKGGGNADANQTDDGCGEDSTWPVGSRPSGVSAFGVLDLSGNVWEWIADWYSPTYYQDSPGQAPAGPSTGTRRAMRGGSWLSSGPSSLRASNRDSDDPKYIGNGVGFRCARDGQ